MNRSERELMERGNKLLDDRTPLLGLWQTIADNFYPERADFLYKRNWGEEFADHLYSSYPVLVRRDLGNFLSSMLRRDDWFKIGVDNIEEKNEASQWLERATKVQFKKMHSRETGFTRATKEGDHDFSSFGQAVLSVELNKNRDGLLYRCWHLRDVAWSEDYAGNVESVFRKWSPPANQIKQLFKTYCPKLDNLKDKHKEIKCMHIVVPRDQYDGDAGDYPYVSIHLDVDNEFVMEAAGVSHKIYAIPRWQTVSGSQYAYSPAAVAGLPDSRLVQAMTRTLLEAGEKFVHPPMIGVKEALRDDVQLFAGGLTWVDAEYDERLGEVLRPLTQDKSGIPLGLEMQNDMKRQIADAFFLTKLNLPPVGKDMTAYEVSERMKEFVRHTLPLFEPMEVDYNGQICEMTFDLLMANGAFGSPYDIPEEIQGADVRFQFSSPIKEAADRDKGRTFLEMKQMLMEAAEIDPYSVANVDINEAFRDAMDGIGVPAGWQNSEREVEEKQEEMKQMEAAMKAMESAA